MSTVQLQPKINILPKSQLLLWNELSTTPNDFILYGGTALALRLGHRKSVNFDFFSPKQFDPEELYNSIPYLKNSKILQKSKNTLTCSVDRYGPVLVSFFGGLN
ncbi:MAG: nucleotidyl transferase AbiEii/AbiGii toxin family protein, partial [Gammaproteobacteria bacterium]